MFTPRYFVYRNSENNMPVIESKTIHVVLIVSKDSEMSSVWDALFRQKNCAVITESSPRAALQTARLFAPSLIILDVDLPHPERLVLCSKLRVTTRGALLLLLPRGQEQAAFDYYNAGVDECLPKHISPLALLVKPIAWLRRLQWLESGNEPQSLQFSS
jgi:DNA-binding response OmpR family regulator